MIRLGLPMAVMLLTAAWSAYGLLAVMAWTAAGAFAFKTAGLKIRLSDEGLSTTWKQGWRKVILVSHRLGCWPFFVWIRRA